MPQFLAHNNDFSTRYFFPSPASRDLQLSIQVEAPWDGACASAGQIPRPQQVDCEGQICSPDDGRASNPQSLWDSRLPDGQNSSGRLLQASAASHRQQEEAGEASAEWFTL